MSYNYQVLDKKDANPLVTEGNYKPKSTRGTINGDLDKDAFLKILMVQLSNQDPLSPMSDTDFIAQMAQFTALEQSQQANSNAAAQRAQSMIGKEIVGDAVMGNDGHPVAGQIFGKVEGAVKVNGVQYVSVDGYLVPLDHVVAVFDKLPEEGDPDKPVDPEKPPVDPEKPPVDPTNP